jgi:hypothetical protein
MDWDGIEIEEKKAYYRKLDQNNATRLNFPGACLRSCTNRDIKCDECFRYSEYVELIETESK